MTRARRLVARPRSLDTTSLPEVGAQAFAGVAEQQGASVDELVDRLLGSGYDPGRAAQLRLPPSG